MKKFTPVECVCLVQNKNKIVVSFIIKCVNIVKLVSLEMQSLMKDKKRSHIWNRDLISVCKLEKEKHALGFRITKLLLRDVDCLNK